MRGGSGGSVQATKGGDNAKKGSVDVPLEEIKVKVDPKDAPRSTTAATPTADPAPSTENPPAPTTTTASSNGGLDVPAGMQGRGTRAVSVSTRAEAHGDFTEI